MANHALPTTTSLYTDVLTNLKDRIDDSLKMLDSVNTTPTNVPTNSVRFNSTTFLWEKYNGSTWISLAASYAIKVLKSSNLVGGNATTLLGAIPYQSAVDTTTLLSPNTTTTRKFLRQTGTGTNGATPVWDTILSSDVPELDVSKITTGTLPVSRGGTGATTSTGTGSVVRSISPTFTGNVVLPSTTSIGTITSTELSYLDGVTAPVQTQLQKNVYTIDTISEFNIVPTGFNVVIVKDLNRGGTFIWSATGTANGGTVFAGATGYWNRQYSGAVNVKWFGAKGDGITDDSSAFNLAFSNFDNITDGSFRGTFLIKDVQVKSNTTAKFTSILKLPSTSVDFTRMFYSSSQENISLSLNILDGNYDSLKEKQIGTHLLYFVNHVNVRVKINIIQNHYISAGNPNTSIDGIRNGNTGAVFFAYASNCTMDVGYINGWSREAIQFVGSNYCEVSLGHAQGTERSLEYSAIQLAGQYNKILRASVDFAGASGIGFDTCDGVASNIISTNTRENHGINFGHTGYPASNSTLVNAVVSNSNKNGIAIAAGTTNFKISNCSVSNSGWYGISCSDGSNNLYINNAKVINSTISNINALSSNIYLKQVDYSSITNIGLLTSSQTGLFTVGETITQATTNATGTVIGFMRGLTPASPSAILLGSVIGVFSTTYTITGSLSESNATLSNVYIPAQLLEAANGKIHTNRIIPSIGSIIVKSDLDIITYSKNVTVSCVANTTTSITYNFNDVVFSEAPKIICSLVAPLSSSGFIVKQLYANASTTTFTINLNTDISQDYVISVLVTGKA